MFREYGCLKKSGTSLEMMLKMVLRSINILSSTQNKQTKKTKKVNGYKNLSWKNSLESKDCRSWWSWWTVVVWVPDCTSELEGWEFGVEEKKRVCIRDLGGGNFLLKKKKAKCMTMEGKYTGIEVKKLEGQNVRLASSWMLTGNGLEEETENQQPKSPMNE